MNMAHMIYKDTVELSDAARRLLANMSKANTICLWILRKKGINRKNKYLQLEEIKEICKVVEFRIACPAVRSKKSLSQKAQETCIDAWRIIRKA